MVCQSNMVNAVPRKESLEFKGIFSEEEVKVHADGLHQRWFGEDGRRENAVQEVILFLYRIRTSVNGHLTSNAMLFTMKC